MSAMRLFLYAFIDNLENILWPNDIIMIKNYEIERDVEAHKINKVVQAILEGPIQV
jgi:hypothetical protein